MKKGRLLVVPILLAALGASVAKAQEHKIGAIVPTTGPLAFLGARQLATYQWWEKEVNAKGGIDGNPVKIMHCNDEANPAKASACARDLIGQGVKLLFNGSVTGSVNATVPLVSDGPVMLVVSPNILPKPGTNVYQISATDMEITQALAEYLKNNKAKRLGMVAATDASGEVGAASVQSVFKESGIPFDIARIDLRATDATTQVVTVARADTSAIYVYYSGGGAATVVKSYKNLGTELPVIMPYSNISDVFVSLIKNDMPKRLLGLAVKAMVPDLIDDPAERARLDYFTRNYQSWRGERIDHLNILGLGAADTAEAILRNVSDPTNVAAVRTFLQSTPIKSYQTIRFSPSTNIGMVSKDIAVVEYKDGEWRKADPLQ